MQNPIVTFASTVSYLTGYDVSASSLVMTLGVIVAFVWVVRGRSRNRAMPRLPLW